MLKRSVLENNSPISKDERHERQTPDVRRSWMRILVNGFPVVLIRFYQICVSPLFPPTCRFTPSCSTYALEAFQKRNLIVALALSMWRVLRCNPFNPGGYDPVPEPKRHAQDSEEK